MMRDTITKSRVTSIAILLALIALFVFRTFKNAGSQEELGDVAMEFSKVLSEGKFEIGMEFVFSEASDPSYANAVELHHQAKDEYEDFIEPLKSNPGGSLGEIESVVVQDVRFTADRWFGRAVTTYRNGNTGKQLKITSAWIRSSEGLWKLTDI